MIKLELPPEPPELTKQKARLTKEFLEDKDKSVWKDKGVEEVINRELLNMTHSKCAYTEAPLGENGNPWEVEHFFPKSLYPEKVVEWGNLLPSCRICNSKKGSHDVGLNPIVNPLRDNPKEFLYVECFRYYPIPEKKEVGRNTIDHLGLNDAKYFAGSRARIAIDLINKAEDYLEELSESISSRRGSRLRGNVLELLEEAGPLRPYSAVIATHLLYENRVLSDLEEKMREKDLWDEELEAAKQVLVSVAMPRPSNYKVSLNGFSSVRH